MDQFILTQGVEDGGSAIRQGQLQKVEIGGIIEKFKNIFTTDMFSRNAPLEGDLIKDPPKCSFLLRVILEFFLVGADPDILQAAESHWMPEGGANFQQHHRAVLDCQLMKAEIDLGFQEAKQPTFQFFVTALYASGLESGADDIVVWLSTPQTR